MKTIPARLLFCIIIIVFVSCQPQNDDDHLIEVNTYYHRRYGTLHVNFLKKSEIIQLYPCKRGKVRFYDNDQLMWFVLSRDHQINNDLIPAGSKITMYSNGNPKYIELSGETEIQGYQVSGKKRLSYWYISFYEDGSLSRFRALSNVKIDGIPCSNQKEINLYPDGRLLTCLLSKDFKTEGKSFMAGTRLVIDEKGKAYEYSSDLHFAINSQLNQYKFKTEELEQAYELRLNGRIDASYKMVKKLRDEGRINPLIHYEMARIKRHKYIGGAPKESLANILESSGMAVYRDYYNVVFKFFDADCALFSAYVSMMEENKVLAAKYYTQAINGFERVLRLKPDYHAARLSLVDIYTNLPEDTGGDREKAEKHAKELKNHDPVWAARAEAILLPGNADRVDFWLKFKETIQDDPQVMHELGRAYLYEGDINNASEYYRQAMEMDSCRNILLLDLARYYMMQIVEDSGMAEEHIPVAEAYIREYLKMDPVQPIQAWCYGNLAKLKKFSGEEDEAERLTATAKKLDRRFSKASTVPPMILFILPGELYNKFEIYFGPF